MDYVSISISLVSLAISLGTFWLTSLRRGRLAMTNPTIVFFGWDFEPKATPKVFIRTLLFSTASRGQFVEGLYATIRGPSDERTFGFWGHGPTKELMAGSGLYVDRTGYSANHHFVLSVHEDPYAFKPGNYEIDVIANVVGRSKPRKLSTIKLRLSEELADALAKNDGVMFERRSNGQFEGHTQQKLRPRLS